ncbi:hypothetical protein [uncultured Ferrovibrio sp.]|uniref:hypothetical protein n=1 Tax=uncultured Ferrovibrio sp. TaxID=1576913 RepID=UPI0026347F5B|nr:hypothetical protein [uncultured Ferrovibrio sp.]
MTPGHPLFDKPGLRTPGMPAMVLGAQVFFLRDVQPLVLQACRHHGVSLDLLARRLGMSRAALTLILRGHDPVPRTLLLAIDAFVADTPAPAGF